MLGKNVEQEISEFEDFVEDIETKLKAILTQPLDASPDTDLELDPEQCNARGHTELQRGEYGLAKAWYLRAGSHSSRYVSNLALACYYLKEYELVLQYADQAIALDADCWKAYWRKLQALKQLNQPQAWAQLIRDLQKKQQQQQQQRKETTLPLSLEIKEGCQHFLERTSIPSSLAWELPGFTSWLTQQYEKKNWSLVCSYMEAKPKSMKIDFNETCWLNLSRTYLQLSEWPSEFVPIFMFLSMELPLLQVPWDIVDQFIQHEYPMEIICNFLKSRPNHLPTEFLSNWSLYLSSHVDRVLFSRLCRIPSLQPCLLNHLESMSTLPSTDLLDPSTLVLLLELKGPSAWIQAILTLPPPFHQVLESKIIGNVALLLSRSTTCSKQAEHWAPWLLEQLKHVYNDSSQTKVASNLAIALAKCSNLSEKVRETLRKDGGIQLLHYMAQKIH